ncbi:Hypothetical predicted protein [Paramuricea clavata]|uniref:BACK domain-containing protein n=1 Tax=Paramuricea clavata TaxID=317549 RepID=A0A6S7FR43_PARCT|nr:Hypothetical predicted protein [Paramuricea clavata]
MKGPSNCTNDDNHGVHMKWQQCRNDLEETITKSQAFKFIEKFLELQEHTMMEVCWRYIDKYTGNVFISEYFLKIKQPTLDALLARDTLLFDEKAIFDAVLNWAYYLCNCTLLQFEEARESRRKFLGDAIYKIRFHTMKTSEFSPLSRIFRKILADHEVVDLQMVINGENVRNLKWDTSKQKREVNF